jgi:hypothetical protein
LTNKWNAREFAKKHACPVPELYWSGTDASRIPFDSLPEHFVIRLAWGHSSKGVYVFAGDLDMIRHARFTRAELIERLGANAPGRGHLILVEEYVENEGGGFGRPLECRVHMFGDEPAAIQAVRFSEGPNSVGRQIWYEPDWTAFDEIIFDADHPMEPVAAPRCLDQLVACSRRLGRAYGTYVRVDFFTTQRGCVFNEFASIPYLGKRQTAFLNEYFEALWQKHFPDAV